MSVWWDARNHGWRVQIEAGRGANRQRKTKLVRVKRRTKNPPRWVLDIADDLQRDVNRGLNLRPEIVRLSLHDYLVDWLETLSPSLSPAAWRSYESKLRVHVIPALGDLRLQAVEPDDVRKLIAAMQRKGLSQRTIHHVYALLKQALQQAEDDNYIARNPCTKLRVSKGRRPEARTLSAVEMAALLGACKRRNDALGTGIALAALAGLRMGEVLGLQARDFEDRGDLSVLHIRRQRQRVRGKPGLQERVPKTAGSAAPIVAGPYLTALLRDALSRLTVRSIDGADWFFPSLSDEVLYKGLKRILSEEGLPVITFHELRHSWATLAGEAGVDLNAIKRHLRHSTISTTADLYAHVGIAMDGTVAGRVERLVLPARDGTEMAQSKAGSED